MLIASRVLKLRREEGETEITIRIFAPELEKPRVCGCRFEIDWPDKKTDKTIFGFNSVQAIVLALLTIGAKIYTSNYHKVGQLFFDKPCTGYGFPVVPTFRDLLQGGDAKYL